MLYLKYIIIIVHLRSFSVHYFYIEFVKSEEFMYASVLKARKRKKSSTRTERTDVCCTLYDR